MEQSLKSVEIPPAAGITLSPPTSSAITNYIFPALSYNPQFPHKCIEEVMSRTSLEPEVVILHSLLLPSILSTFSSSYVTIYYFNKSVDSWLYYTTDCLFSSIFWRHRRCPRREGVWWPREIAITYSYISYESPHLLRAHCMWVHIGGWTDRNNLCTHGLLRIAQFHFVGCLCWKYYTKCLFWLLNSYWEEEEWHLVAVNIFIHMPNMTH